MEISPTDVTYEDNSTCQYSRIFSEFDIMEVLGTGTFGTVYKVRGRMDNSMYAIKKSKSKFKGDYERSTMMHEVSSFALNFNYYQ